MSIGMYIINDIMGNCDVIAVAIFSVYSCPSYTYLNYNILKMYRYNRHSVGRQYFKYKVWHFYLF